MMSTSRQREKARHRMEIEIYEKQRRQILRCLR